MGLDMFLFTVPKEQTEGWDNEKLNKAAMEDEIEFDGIAYWRKANAIHRFFVDNVQKGDDSGGNYFVSIEDIKELKNRCDTILEVAYTGDYWTTVAKDMLPTQSGFFFGDTEYDEFYMDGIEYTSDIVDSIIDNPEEYKNVRFVYNAWW